MPKSNDQHETEHDETTAGTPLDAMDLPDEAVELIKQLQAQRDEALEGRLRALADFRNYQRRAGESEQRAYDSGSIRAVRAIFPVLDHFDQALSQNPEQMKVDQLLHAVQMMRGEFDKALGNLGVQRIEPQPGEPFDPHRHEAVMRQAVQGAPPDSITSTLQAGYALGELVLRPARVAVAQDQPREDQE